jgi:hypothetical protein
VEPFYALSPQWWRCDRFFKVSADADSMFGFWLGGQFFDKTSARVQLLPFCLTIIGIPIVEGIATWAQKRRARMERQYDESITEPTAAVSKDARNFIIAKSDIVAMEVSRKRSHWTVWSNRGTLTIVQRNGNRLRLIVIYRQDLDTIPAHLRGLGFAVTNPGACQPLPAKGAKRI